MMAIERKKCLYYVVCVIALLFLCNSILAQTTTGKKATFVFRVPFGKAINNIGVQWGDPAGMPENNSTCGISVCADGDIYIGDFVQNKIKRYSTKGEFLGVIGGATVLPFTTDFAGNVYVSGMMVAKYAKDGHLLWQKTVRDLIPDEQFVKAEKDMNVKIDRSFSGSVDASKKELMVKMHAKGTDVTSSRNISAVFDNDGKFVKFLPYYPKVSGGLYWTYKRENIAVNDNEPPGSATISIYSERGNLIKELKPDFTIDADKHYKGRLADGGFDIITDNRDNIWVKTIGKIDTPIVIKKGVEVNREYILNKYNLDGTFVEELRLPYSPFMAAAPITVAEDGTLYYMQFDKDGINVMAYK
ncbi:MAG: hypothetical protein WCJ56_05710 [bacterium]